MRFYYSVICSEADDAPTVPCHAILQVQESVDAYSIDSFCVPTAHCPGGKVGRNDKYRKKEIYSKLQR